MLHCETFSIASQVSLKDCKTESTSNTVLRLLLHGELYFSASGARLSKVPKTFRARKAIPKLPTSSFSKAGPLICCKGNKN